MRYGAANAPGSKRTSKPCGTVPKDHARPCCMSSCLWPRRIASGPMNSFFDARFPRCHKRSAPTCGSAGDSYAKDRSCLMQDTRFTLPNANGPAPSRVGLLALRAHASRGLLGSLLQALTLSSSALIRKSPLRPLSAALRENFVVVCDFCKMPNSRH